MATECTCTCGWACRHEWCGCTLHRRIDHDFTLPNGQRVTGVQFPNLGRIDMTDIPDGPVRREYDAAFFGGLAIGLHNHACDEDCDDTCTFYPAVDTNP